MEEHLEMALTSAMCSPRCVEAIIFIYSESNYMLIKLHEVNHWEGNKSGVNARPANSKTQRMSYSPGYTYNNQRYLTDQMCKPREKFCPGMYMKMFPSEVPAGGLDPSPNLKPQWVIHTALSYNVPLCRQECRTENTLLKSVLWMPELFPLPAPELWWGSSLNARIKWKWMKYIF